jgi:hypothetical protein
MKQKAIYLILLIPLLLTLVGCEDDDVVNSGVIPAVPAGVYSITHDGYIEIRWQENRDNGLTEGYGVYYYTGDVNGLEEYELMTTVNANTINNAAVYLDYDVSNGEFYKYAVNAYNEYGESELSYEDVFDTPRPQGNASVYDFRTHPEQAGFDFSRIPNQVVDWEHPEADIFFEYDPDPSFLTFFVYVGGENYELVDIQDYGYTTDITDVNWGDPGGGWSNLGWMELILGHSYIVWTADNHFAAFRVNATNPTTGRVSITWSYQTDPGNPELKRANLPRPEHTENYGRRER